MERALQHAAATVLVLLLWRHIVGTQPRAATWAETKALGGGYAITINGQGGVVEGVRIDNHHDAFVPYRADGFVFAGNWVSYNRDDCIENDGHAAGRIADNLFDGCTTRSTAVITAFRTAREQARRARCEIESNLILMQNMPGPYNRRDADGDRSKAGYEAVFKTREKDARVPKLVLRDNVIAYEVPVHRRSTQLWSPPSPVCRVRRQARSSGSARTTFPARLPGAQRLLQRHHRREIPAARFGELRERWISTPAPRRGRAPRLSPAAAAAGVTRRRARRPCRARCAARGGRAARRIAPADHVGQRHRLRAPAPRRRP